MPTLSANVAQVLDPAKSEIFIDGFIGAELTFYEWMSVLPGITRTIEHASIRPPAGYTTRVEGDDYPTTGVVEGPNLTYTMSERVFGASNSAFTDLFLDRVAKAEYVRMVGLAAGRQLSADAHSILSGGFATNGPDGVPLFSNVHPTPGAADQDNLGTSALDYAALNAAYVLGGRRRSPDNLVAPVRYNALFVPPDLHGAALQIVRNTTINALSGATNTRDNVNPFAEWIGRVYVVPEFDDVNDWVLCDTQMGRTKFRMYVRKGPSPVEYVDLESDNWRIKDNMVYATGHEDAWWCCFGAQVA